MRILAIFVLSSFLTISTANADETSEIRGKKVFLRCSMCHFADKEQNKIGPSLLNILNRQAGTVANYHYSPAMIKAGEKGLHWTKETLKTYLHAPHSLVPGTKMIPIHLPDNAIDDLISYLESVEKKDDHR